MLELDRLDLVSWDVDGTLYSLLQLRIAISAAVLRGLGSGRFAGDMRELGELRRWNAKMDAVRRGGGNLTAAYANGDSARIRAERERVRGLEQRWYGDAIAKVGLRREVTPLYETLRARGLRQVVLSDYDSAYKLEALGLSGAFDAVFSGEGVGWLKPSEELYRHVARALNVAPERWLHIGDRVDRDERPARAIGCQTLILGRTPKPSARVVRR